MKVNQEQKDLLIGVIEQATKGLDIYDNMQFGTDLTHLLEQANKIKVIV